MRVKAGDTSLTSKNEMRDTVTILQGVPAQTRVITTCPNGHDLDLLSAVWRSKAEIPPDWTDATVCYFCGQCFTVTMENCSIVQSKASGVVQ